MTKKTRVGAMLAVMALATAACASGAGPGTTQPTPSPTIPGPEVTLLKANLPRVTDTDVTDDELGRLVAGNTDFAFGIFKVIRPDGDNLIFSPYSIASALTMSYAGARGDTASEIREAISLALAEDRLHAARNQLDLRITEEPQPFQGDEREPFTIRVANSLWGQAGYPFLDEFLELLAANYDAGMNLVDFATAFEEARLQINTWVEEETEGRIVDLIPEDVIDDMTRLVLVNAIWFKANWAEPFDPERTSDGPFTLLDGSLVEVPMMRGSLRIPYTVGDGFQALRIPYAGDAAMVVVLPDRGRFAEIAEGFGPDDLSRLHGSWGDYQVELSFPRFEFRSDVPLKGPLQQLGMEAAFRDPFGPGGADFTGITALRELYVQDVVHQAFISVDEEGTEAAAATAVVIGRTSMPTPAEVDVDRPFLFFIEHGSTGEILFLGQVVDPS